MKYISEEVAIRIAVFQKYLGQTVQYPNTNGKLTKAKLTGVFIGDKVPYIETTYSRKKDGCSGDILYFNENHQSNAFEVKVLLKRVEELDVEHLTDIAKIILDDQPIEEVVRESAFLIRVKYVSNGTIWSTKITLNDWLNLANPKLIAYYQLNGIWYDGVYYLSKYGSLKILSWNDLLSRGFIKLI